MAVVGTEAHYHYLPSEYIIFALLLVQGLVEGAAFRATVFTLHKKVMELYYVFPYVSSAKCGPDEQLARGRREGDKAEA